MPVMVDTYSLRKNAEENDPEGSQRELDALLEENSEPSFEEEPMDPKKIEEEYRQVGEEEWSERHPKDSDILEWPSEMEEVTKEDDLKSDITKMFRDKLSPRAPDWAERIESGSSRPLSASLLRQLVKIASELDGKGLYAEASLIDDILRESK